MLILCMVVIVLGGAYFSRRCYLEQQQKKTRAEIDAAGRALEARLRNRTFTEILEEELTCAEWEIINEADVILRDASSEDVRQYFLQYYPHARFGIRRMKDIPGSMPVKRDLRIANPTEHQKMLDKTTLERTIYGQMYDLRTGRRLDQRTAIKADIGHSTDGDPSGYNSYYETSKYIVVVRNPDSKCTVLRWSETFLTPAEC
jgi:hypothetical protein